MEMNVNIGESQRHLQETGENFRVKSQTVFDEFP